MVTDLRVVQPAVLSYSLSIGSLSNYDDHHNDDVKKTIGLMIKTIALHVYYAFSTFLWRPLHDYDVKSPNLTFYGGCGHKTTNFPSSFWTWRTEIRKNSTPGKLACINLTYWAGPNRRDWVWNNANSFFSDVFTAVVVIVYHSYDYRPNWTPLSPVAITNQCHNKRVLRFFLSKLIYKSNRKLFPCIC